MDVTQTLVRINELPDGELPFLCIGTGYLNGRKYFLAYQITAVSLEEAKNKAEASEIKTHMWYLQEKQDHGYSRPIVMPFTLKLYFAFFTGCEIHSEEIVNALISLPKADGE